MFAKRVDETERRSYGCSFEATSNDSLFMVNNGGPLRVHRTEKVSGYLLWNLSPTGGVGKIGKKEEDSDPYSWNFNATALYDIEARNREHVADFTEEKITIKQLRDACVSFMYKSSEYRASVVDDVKDSVINDVKVILNLKDEHFAANFENVAMRSFRAHLPDGPDIELPVIKCSQFKPIRSWLRRRKIRDTLVRSFFCQGAFED
ncbi:hypothetical protein FOL47_000793 [Perkinsus chesapeaki]|uniref:Uncharacterized protein n=1 Tax=Perkinsus chesapeaki TaxID=330153 RepID=A0A7J6MLY9_PERCH|nr:hypothetical protein FOL47_000793 [Perkinsus chesapeaki]